MRNFLYISEEKIENLHAQLIAQRRPSLRDRLAPTVGVNTGVFSLGVTARQIDLNLYHKLERVCHELQVDGKIHDISIEPAEGYIRGTCIVAWGFWPRRLHNYAEVAFFIGYPDSRTILGLGGSAYHTTERQGDRGSKFANSSQGALMTFLKERSEPHGDSASNGAPAWSVDIGEADFFNQDLTRLAEIEFVAKVLEYEPSDYTGYRCILASPIYIAETERPVSPLMKMSFNHQRASYARAHALQSGFGTFRHSLMRSRYQPSLLAPPSDKVWLPPEPTDK
ncbi:DUF7019 family protein [Nakamurella endophytica]|uniref:Uncharacterized protein n=1 Tax=Nakamurella endophytica TaxID=1748367 RepID=A0A917WMY0_9ACTN|nr:SAVMC3_10250 family protein [Nakamurella endophytica]GGM16077.1 hypothetical protein GCM10011594_40100 [Nakamurella endophytica]